MKNKRKETRFLRFSKRLLVMSFIVFVVGIVALNSYESTINVALEKDIKTIESDIDGLDMKKLELASFSRIESVAEAKGYTYKQNTATAAVVGVPEE